MKSTHILFDEPDNYIKSNRFPYFGGSPKFVSFLKEYLCKYSKEMYSVSLALYLFNNYELHRLFRELAEKGIRINVVSIPLEGYDNSSPQRITSDDGSVALKNKHTKYSLAKNIYQNFLAKPLPNYKFFIFPHTYIRSHRIRSFSRGKVPYSLHIKSLMVKFKDGSTVTGLSSSNLAMRDMVKHDTFVLREAKHDEARLTDGFFKHLMSASIPIEDFQQGSLSPLKNVLKQQKCAGIGSTCIVAPFYARSAENAEAHIIELMQTAKKRIWIMAQHISAFNYTVPLNYKIRKQTNAIQKKKGLLHTLLEKGSHGIEVVCLSQTFVDGSGNNQEYRKPVNQYNFIDFVKEYRKLPESKYFVNEAVHSKYIIVDDTVIVSTFNYTPTQFIYLPYVKIDKFEHIDNLKYEGVFSEVGQCMLFKNRKEVECFKKNFQYIVEKKETKRVI